MQKLCGIRVLCSDKEPPCDLDIVPVHSRRQHFDAVMPLLMELGLLFSGLVGVA
jgi:hypothetical protein